MIVIDNQHFDVSELIGEYPEGSVERDVLNMMSESADTFRYDSLSQLQFELRLRRETVRAAKELSRSGLGFSVFHKSRCNPVYWERTDNGGFRLKDGVKPSKAINDIFAHGGQYATECATAMLIVFYKAILTVFGTETFDTTFPEIYLMDWHSLDPLLRDVGKPRKTSTLLSGDRGYFDNPDVDPKKPEWQGENVIVLPDNFYYGHGIGIETADVILSELNQRRKPDAQEKASLLDAAGRPNYRKLADLYEREDRQAVLYGAEPVPSLV